MEMTNEKWKPVKGYEGLYLVSSAGRVWSTYRGRYKNATLQNGGYPLVWLSKDGKRCAKLVHRLVAEAFIDNPDGLKEVNHKDGVKTNNTVGNLEWCSRSENLTHRARVLGQRGNAKKVLCVDTGVIFDAIKDAAIWAGVTPGAIRQSVMKENRKAGGYKWEAV